MEQPTADPLAELITTYNELNSPIIEELDGEPSPLEFMRYVSRNTPFVVRNAAANWSATKTWNAQYLEASLRDQTVNVAVTPKGNADSPTRLDENGELFFAKPWEEDQAFPEFLDYVRRQETDSSFPKGSEIRYAQTQNDNLRHEYVSLFSQVQRDIPFARIALEKEPDAINMWIGNSHSVTALHKDNYENIYVQIQGQKHFVLLPPHCYPCVNENPLRPGTYARKGSSDQLGLVMDAGEGGEGEAERVPFAIWDPDSPDYNATPYSRLAEPMRVTLEQGDMLYLPAMWYHKVSQSCSDEGISVAVNYWYDMEFSGPLYPLTSFVRSVSCEVGALMDRALRQTDPVRRADDVKIAHRELHFEVCEVGAHAHAPDRDATAVTTAPAPPAGGGDADSEAEALELLRSILVQLTRIADTANGLSKLKDR